MISSIASLARATENLPAAETFLSAPTTLSHLLSGAARLNEIVWNAPAPVATETEYPLDGEVVGWGWRGRGVGGFE